MEEDDNENTAQVNITGKIDSDSMKEDDEWSEDDRHQSESEYDEEYYQKSDMHLHYYANLSGSGSDVDSLSFEKNL